MRQNLYDNDSFDRSYINLRENAAGLNDVLEIPAFRALLPCLSQMKILDLGCGSDNPAGGIFFKEPNELRGRRGNDSMTD